jgi:hypothetical protein
MGQPLGADQGNQPVTDPSELSPTGTQLLGAASSYGPPGNTAPNVITGPDGKPALTNPTYPMLSYHPASGMDASGGTGLADAIHGIIQNVFGGGGAVSAVPADITSQTQALASGNQIGPANPTAGEQAAANADAGNLNAYASTMPSGMDSGGMDIGGQAVGGGGPSASQIGGGIASAIGQFASDYQKNEPRYQFQDPAIPLPKLVPFQSLTLAPRGTGAAPWQT